MSTSTGRERGKGNKASIIMLAAILLITFAGQAGADGGYQSPLLSRGNALTLIDSVGPSGAASQSISIAVPPGRHGMQPSITIGYSSSGGNSEYGYGWGYDPGAIERSTKNGVPRNFNTNDSFVLNGENLVRISVGASYDEYKTERESFSQIMGYKSGSDYDYWVVKDKSGTIYYYGDTGAANSEIVVTGKTAIRKWGLRQVTDTNGNSYTVTYTTDATNSPGAIYPSHIDYNGMIVNFGWELRNDKINSYRDGGQVKTAYRLKYIETKVGANRQSVYAFGYTYSTSTNRSLLTSVTEYGSNATIDGSGNVTGTALPARTFAYSTSSGAGWTTQAWNIPYPSGDGFESGDGPQSATRMMDINGDGLPDFVYSYEMYYHGGFHHNTKVVRLNNGDGTWGPDVSATWNPPVFYHWDYGTAYPPTKWRGIVADINGDGLTEPEGYINTGNGWVAQAWNVPYPSGDIYASGDGPQDATRMMDINGDGLPDMVYSYEKYQNGVFQYRNKSVRLNNGDGTWGPELNGTWDPPVFYSYNAGTAYPPSRWNGMVADFNGDGLDEMEGYINTGNGWAAQAWNVPYPSGDIYASGDGPQSATRMMDINGDGLPDMIYSYQKYQGTVFQYSNKSVRLNNGDGTWGPELNATWDPPVFYTYNQGTASLWNGMVMDFNGDGFAEPEGQKSLSSKPDLLITATNGIGGSVSYTYQVWGYAGDAVPMPVMVVSSAAVNDGLGNTSTTSYSYSGGSWKKRTGNTPAEFRGFRTVTVTKPNGSKTVTYYLQGDIYKGLMEKSYVKDSSNNIYAATVNTYDYMETNNANTVKTDESLATGGVYLPRVRYTYSYSVEGVTSDENLPAGTYRRSSIWRNYDTYGNVTEVDRMGDRAYETMSTITSYINDTSSHILGVPCQVTVSGYDINNTWVTQSQSKMYYDGYTTNCSQSVPKGNLTRTDSYKDATSFVTVTMGYDAYGSLKWTQDANGNTGATCAGVTSATSCIDYDTTYNAFPVKTCNANNFCSTISYDSLIRPTQVVDINNQSTYSAYDVFGRVTAVAKPLDTLASPTVQTVYNDTASLPGNPAYVQTIAKDGSANGLIGYTFVDGLGRTIQTKSEGVGANEWYTVDTLYNSYGMLDRTCVPYTTTTTTPQAVSRRAWGDVGVWTYPTYDGIGRVYRNTKPDGTYTETNYGKWEIWNYDELRHVKISYLNGLGMVTQVNNYTGTSSANYAFYATTTFQYNTGTGQLVKLTDPAGNVTTTTYDMLGRKTGMTDPDMGTWSYGYDANGNLTVQTDAKGQMFTFDYDKLNRIKHKYYPTGYNTVYEYDSTTNSPGGKGRPYQVWGYSGGNNSQYSEIWSWYDERGRTKQSILWLDAGKNWQTGTSYDSLDRVTSISYPDGEIVTYRYNKAGKLASPDGGTTPAVQSNIYTNYAYIKNMYYKSWGSLASILLGNNVYDYHGYYVDSESALAEPTSGLRNTYRERMHYIYQSVSPYATILDNSPYGYDATGNVTSVPDNTNSNYSATYTYDDLSRLTQASATVFGTTPFSYNNIGNILSNNGRTYTYPASGPNGCGTGIPCAQPHAPTAFAGTSNTYDNNGNMTARGTRTFQWDYDNMLISVDNGSTGSYAYDAGGARVRKVENGITTYYVGSHYEEEWSGTTKLHATKYYYANGQRIAKRRDGVVSFIHTDHLGSSSRTTDANGNLQYTIVYTPYGDDAYSNDTGAMDYRFTGKEKDDATGLYYYGARYYDPALARFISADSVEGPNRYAYVDNNPVNKIDPTGNISMDIGNNQTMEIPFDPFGFGSGPSIVPNANATAAERQNATEGNSMMGVSWNMTTTVRDVAASAALMIKGVQLGIEAKAAKEVTGFQGSRFLTSLGSGLTNIGANRLMEMTLGGEVNWNQAPLDMAFGSAIGLSNTFTTEIAKSAELSKMLHLPRWTEKGSLKPLKNLAVEKATGIVDKAKNVLSKMELGESVGYQYAGTTALWMSYAYVKGQLYAGGKFPTLDRIIPSRAFTLGQMMLMTEAWQTPLRIVGGSLANAWMSYMQGGGSSGSKESIPSWVSPTIRDAMRNQGSMRYKTD